MNIQNTRSRTPPPCSTSNTHHIQKQPVITHLNRLYHVQQRNFNFKSRNTKNKDQVASVDNNKLHLGMLSTKHMHVKCSNKHNLHLRNKKFKIVNENSFQFNSGNAYSNTCTANNSGTHVSQHALHKIANMRKRLCLRSCSNKNYQIISEVQKELDMSWIGNLCKDEVKYRNVNTSFNIQDNFNSYERVLFPQQGCGDNRSKINIFPLLRKAKVNNSFQMYKLLHYNTKPAIQRSNNNNNIRSKLKLNFFMNKDKIKNMKSKVSQYIHSHSRSNTQTNNN